MTHSHNTIEEAAEHINNLSTPVLILDTCALLDLIRVPLRSNDANLVKAILLAARKVLLLAQSTPKSLCIVIPPLVPDEWEKNSPGVLEEVKQHFCKLDNMINIASATADCLAISNSKSLFSIHQLPETLLNLSKEILNSGIRLYSQDVVRLRASDRAANYIAPSSKGAIKDCIIYEHALELFSELRHLSFVEKCVFMTSNTNDFCETTNKTMPREPIMAEMNAASFTLTTTWNWALHELGLT